MLRIAHVSDVHVQSRIGAEWRRMFLNKRITGWANVVLQRERVHRRERRFAHHFAPFVTSDRPGLAVTLPAGDYPLVKLRGPAPVLVLPPLAAPRHLRRVIEIQHALLRAIARGVTVREIVGHTTPTHQETPFHGPWSTARQAASELVDSRLDALIAAGAEVYRIAVRERPGWAAGLGTVHPHVHAKVVSVDGRICSVGSANLDVTAAYWEDEHLLVVEDETVAGTLEARLEEIAGSSERIEPDDEQWHETARRRTWMLRWPGMLSV